MSGDEPMRVLSHGQAEEQRPSNQRTSDTKVHSTGQALASTPAVVISPIKAAVNAVWSPGGIADPASEHAVPSPVLRRRRLRGRLEQLPEARDANPLLEELRTGILTKPERAAQHLQRPVGLPRPIHLLLQAEALVRVQQMNAAARCVREAVAVARHPDIGGVVDETVLLRACAVRADLACLQTAPDALATAVEFFSLARRSADEPWYYPAASLRAVALFHRGAQQIGRHQLASLIDRHQKTTDPGRLHRPPAGGRQHPSPAAADAVQMTLGKGIAAMTPDSRPVARRLPDPWLVPAWGGLLHPDLMAPSRWLLTTRIAAHQILR